MYKRHHFMLMSALGVALSAGAGAVAAAFDSAEKFVVTGALKVTHIITEQVCDFDTLDQLETYLASIADRHNWFRHDQPAAVAGEYPRTAQDPLGQRGPLVVDQIDTASDQYAALASAPSPIVNLDLEQLRAGAAPADVITITAPETGGQATAQLEADGSPMRNPHYAGEFEGETAEQAEARRAAAAAAQQPTTTNDTAA